MIRTSSLRATSTGIDLDDAPAVLYERPHWYACYTRGRHEKSVALLLERSGVESFLPVRIERHQWTDRVREIEVPMFPSYVFGRFRLVALPTVLDTPGLVTVIRFRRYPVPIRDAEIENVRLAAERAQTHGADTEVLPYVEEGDCVRVVSGPFNGVEGIVCQCRGRNRMLVGLSNIGLALSVEIHITELVRIDRPAAGRQWIDAQAATSV